ncbi:MAG: hypothetical protein JSR97_01030 [Verrucomicrobia bacterium]|nr:hypothetical protein [Verrucomicrobiota bacterium]
MIGTLAFLRVLPLPCSSLPVMISGWGWTAGSLLCAAVLCVKNRANHQTIPARVDQDRLGKPVAAPLPVVSERDPPPAAMPAAASRAVPTAAAAAPKAAPRAAAAATEEQIREQIQVRIADAHRYIDGVDQRFIARLDLSKDQLKQDFNLVLRQADLSASQQLDLIEKMLDALPYCLGEKIYEYSTFPLVGIPNYTGNSCYLNSDLQALVHSRMGDYLLLRPVEIPPALEEPPVPVAPDKVNWALYEMDRTDDRRIAASRAYDAAFEAYRDLDRAYPGQKRAYDGRCRIRQTMQKEEEIRRDLRSLVWQIRAGKVPTREQMHDFAIKVVGEGYKRGGDTGRLLQYAHVGHGIGPFNLSRIKEENVLETTPWSIIVYGAGAHLTVIVRTSKGFSWINDNSVSRYSIKEIKDQIVPTMELDGKTPTGGYRSKWSVIGLKLPSHVSLSNRYKGVPVVP